jgi:four helix bundle protein
MPTVRRFEELEVWQSARRMAGAVYRASAIVPFERDWALRDQIRRAAISVMANIAEGFNRGTKKEFLLFLTYSLASASEVKSHVYLAQDLGHLSEPNALELLNDVAGVSGQLTNFIKYLKSERAR